MKTYKTHSELN